MDFDKLIPENIENVRTEFVPLMSQEEEDKMMKQEFNDILPLLPLRNTVLFPGVITPINAGRETSKKLLEDAYKADRTIAVLSQIDDATEEPTEDDLHSVGTIVKILKLLPLPDGNIMVILQGVKRFSLTAIVNDKPYLIADIKQLEDKTIGARKKKSFEVLLENLRETAIQNIELNPNIPSEASFAIKNIEGNMLLINFIASNLDLPVEEKQFLLELDSLEERATQTLKLLNIEIKKSELKNKIHDKVNGDLNKQQKDYFLQQQIRAIQEELGVVSTEGEIEELRARAKSKKWKKEIGEQFEKELNRLIRINPQAPDFNIQRNYVELMLELPWDASTKDNLDINHAQKVLDKHHFGLEDVKERILEYLAVLKLKNNMKSPIICLYGPPGVGKTSLGRSIAEALGRKYERLALGGLHDESELRGHRKTYIGAMPGRIIQTIKKVDSANPVIVLDEIDKISRGNHGDPSSALLEILDPEQNNTFHDNFLEVDYDLSKVMFIATANDLSTIQPALRDRMEIIDISGYTIEEKVEIAHKFLLPKELKENGLKKKDLSIDKKELEFISQSYTRESGVRNLNRKIAKIARNIALYLAKEQEYETKVSKEKIVEILGPPLQKELAEKSAVGVVTGLAWTQVGGDILFIESILSKGTGKLSMTGNLGTVMKESATIALEYIKANYSKFGIKADTVNKSNIHIHVPEGATPKDGPSAGITMLTSLVSSFLNKPVKANIAMTGEITLRGKVLPVGGIKEKILAAKRAGIKTIILCKDNEKDILEINPKYIQGLNIQYVSKMEEVIKLAI